MSVHLAGVDDRADSRRSDRARKGPSLKPRGPSSRCRFPRSAVLRETRVTKSRPGPKKFYKALGYAVAEFPSLPAFGGVWYKGRKGQKGRNPKARGGARR